ncbi:hypothetical protein BJ508DRAFT_362973 [Ascobolus immersus RN42]|uniref:Uncharacterized protein n=1 Tax=Ascobolus immersus RN42 TaxID=1160509 RepID=A0A3N4I0T8_ASCIM|nr:hypothetical protein BJ508DRAFT_362973 [Ascobolus immersus RN42]
MSVNPVTQEHNLHSDLQKALSNQTPGAPDRLAFFDNVTRPTTGSWTDHVWLYGPARSFFSALSDYFIGTKQKGLGHDSNPVERSSEPVDPTIKNAGYIDDEQEFLPVVPLEGSRGEENRIVLGGTEEGGIRIECRNQEEVDQIFNHLVALNQWTDVDVDIAVKVGLFKTKEEFIEMQLPLLSELGFDKIPTIEEHRAFIAALPVYPVDMDKLREEYYCDFYW